MKKKYALLLLGVCLIFIPACGNQEVSDYSISTSGSAPIGEISDSKDTEPPEDDTDVDAEKQIDFEELKETISIEFDEFEETASIDVENTIKKIKADFKKLKTDTDTWEKYLENFDMVEVFDEQLCEDVRNLYIRLYGYDLDLAEKFVAHAEELEELNAEEWKGIRSSAEVDSYGIYEEIDDIDRYYLRMGQDASLNRDISYDEYWLFCRRIDIKQDAREMSDDFRKAHESLWEKLKDSVSKHNMEAAERIISDFRESMEEL